VPELSPADPLITEAVREALTLRDRRSRLARDAFLYTALVEGRAASGSVTVVTAQVDADGEPCRPSRVLLQAQPQDLPARVLAFVREKPDVQLLHTPPWARGDWQVRPPAGARANKAWDHVSPSTLKTYLACPTRFYFAKVLGWEPFEPFNGELDAARFGSLLHDVLRDWGHDPAAREIADAAKLRTFWRDALQRLAAERFGESPSSLIRLQLMSAEERLAALAPSQAEQRQLGWHVVDVEKDLDGVLTLAGLPVHLRVDRIDRHDDGRVRVIDYKTGKTGETPHKAHLRNWSAEKCPAALGPLCTLTKKGRGEILSHGWTDLQLPLYVAAVKQQMGLTEFPEACYALLPEAVGDSEFAQFKDLSEGMENALQWAEEAARRIRDGVFWPPAPEVTYDSLAALAPEGLRRALGNEWAGFLAGTPPVRGGNAA
jgi:ATP-dependent helicase/nuclease subunit B